MQYFITPPPPVAYNRDYSTQTYPSDSSNTTSPYICSSVTFRGESDYRRLPSMEQQGYFSGGQAQIQTRVRRLRKGTSCHGLQGQEKGQGTGKEERIGGLPTCVPAAIPNEYNVRSCQTLGASSRDDQPYEELFYTGNKR